MSIEVHGPPTPIAGAATPRIAGAGNPPTAGAGAVAPAGIDTAPDAGKPAAPDRERAALEGAAREFEAVFLGVLMRAMRATVPEGGLFSQGGAGAIYRDLHDAELARHLAGGHSGVGIAEMVIKQLNAATDEPDAPTPPTPPAPPAPPAAPAVRRGLAAYRTETGSRAPTALERVRELATLAPGAAPAAADTLRTWGGAIARASDETDVDPALVLAVMQAESAGRADAVSPRGARGLMQLMPGTAREVGVDPDRPEENVLGGARYLGGLLERYAGRLDLALAAYNAGPGSVDRAGRAVPDYPETRRYVEKVLDLYGKLAPPPRGSGRAGAEWHGSGGVPAPTVLEPEPPAAEES
ncbi:MAG: transglycosylase SLT domain-containing protein [Candidatus Krumholzibacteriia bacterium]